MKKEIIYLDNAATTRVCGEAAEIAFKVMTEKYGNPSSTHALGREAAGILSEAREKVSGALGAKPDEVFFTSGGTESDNWALLSGASLMSRRGRHIISSMAEHDAVRKALDELEARGFEVTRLKPEPDGSIAASSVAEALRGDTILVSLMLVNNETGAVTDIAAVKAAMVGAKSGALLHTDAVQGFLKLSFTVKSLGADMITVSGHKIHAPKGVGALFVKKGLKLPPRFFGGSQEAGLRAGTEAVPLIAAFGEAASVGFEHMAEHTGHMLGLRNLAANEIKARIPDAMIIGGGAPHIVSLALPGAKGEVLMNWLEAEGIYVSKSAACKKGARSHVLEAIGLSGELTDGAIRVGLSRYTTESEIIRFAQLLHQGRERLFPPRRSRFS